MALRTHRYRHCPFLFIFLLIIRLRMIHHCISSWNLSDCYLFILKRKEYWKYDGFANASISTSSTFIHVIFINNSFKNDTSLHIIFQIVVHLLSIWKGENKYKNTLSRGSTLFEKLNDFEISLEIFYSFLGKWKNPRSNISIRFISFFCDI